MKALFGFGLVIIMALALTVGISWESTHETLTVTVEDKDRTTGYKGSSDMRVYTDEGVFSVSDDWVQGKFNSADTFAALEVGHTYEIETVGWRNGFFSAFPNIIEVHEVEAG